MHDPSPAPHASLPPGIDRRGFLRMSAGGTVAIAAASFLPSACAADYPIASQDGVRLLALSEKEYAVARAAAEALLIGVPVDAAAVARTIDHELSLIGDPIRSDMKTVFALLEHLTILGGHLSRFTTLHPDARLAYLRGWGRSRMKLRRGAYGAVRAFVYFFAYTHDATRPLTGYEGPWLERVRIPAYPIDFGEVA